MCSAGSQASACPPRWGILEPRAASEPPSRNRRGGRRRPKNQNSKSPMSNIPTPQLMTPLALCGSQRAKLMPPVQAVTYTRCHAYMPLPYTNLDVDPIQTWAYQVKGQGATSLHALWVSPDGTWPACPPPLAFTLVCIAI